MACTCPPYRFPKHQLNFVLQYLIEGVFTVFCGLVFFFLLPDNYEHVSITLRFSTLEIVPNVLRRLGSSIAQTKTS